MFYLKFTDLSSSSAYKVSERHSALVDNIGTFAREDEAYELLNNLRMSLPFVVMITSFFEALLACVYLKCLHPWKILLQEVSSLSFLFLSFTIAASQEPDQWEVEDDAGAEQANEVGLSFILHSSSDFSCSKSRRTRPGMSLLLPLLMEKR